jgi:hypothetical protein
MENVSKSVILENIQNKTNEKLSMLGNKVNSLGVGEKQVRIFLIIIGIVIVLRIFFILYASYKGRDGDFKDTLKNPMTYSLWTEAPTSTLGIYKTSTSKIFAPENDNIINYSMQLYIKNWTHGYGINSKELFNHGDTKSCCGIGKHDIINVELDDKVNNLRVSVLTNQTCPSDTSKLTIVSLSVGKNEVFGIFKKFISFHNPDSKKLFKKNNLGKLGKGDGCWHEILINSSDIENPVPNLVDVRTIDIKVSENEYQNMIFLLSSDAEGFSLGRLHAQTTQENNLYEYDYVPIKNNFPMLVDSTKMRNFDLILKDENTIYIFYKKVNGKTYYLEYSIDVAHTSDEAEWVEDIDNNTSNIPIDSEKYLWVTDTGNKTLYKCKKPCAIEDGAAGTAVRNYEREDLEYEFKSIAVDSSKIWGVEKSTNKIFQKKHDVVSSTDSTVSTNTQSWEFAGTQGTNAAKLPIINGIYGSKFSEEDDELWGILEKNNKFEIKRTNKCSAEFTDTCAIEENIQRTETLTIENIPVGRPFHLIITLTSKRIDVYIDGKLVTTEILNGKRPKEKTGKQFRFFGSPAKVEGTLSYFRYMPFKVEMSTLRMLAKKDSKKWSKKCQ